MFGRKKEVTQTTALDRKVMEAFKVIHESRDALENKVLDVILKNCVVALYPEGADKAKAIVDTEQAKQYMVNAIAQYDEAMRELNHVLALEGERKTTAEWGNHFCDSHKIIENVYYRHCIK